MVSQIRLEWGEVSGIPCCGAGASLIGWYLLQATATPATYSPATVLDSTLFLRPTEPGSKMPIL